jgi:hypothetical protein
VSWLDRYRLIVSVVLALLGLVILVRAIDARAWPLAVLGIVMIALAGYRLKQYMAFRQGAER